jgi:hypothetical protein
MGLEALHAQSKYSHSVHLVKPVLAQWAFQLGESVVSGE